MSPCDDRPTPGTDRSATAGARGQGGFILLTSLAMWMLVGGAIMVALLGMTLSVTSQAKVQREHAQQVRAVDGALETAVAQVQIDPSGRVGLPTGKGDGTCTAGLDNPRDELVVDDGLGNAVTVTATCSGSTKKNDVHQVELTARLGGPDGPPSAIGRATLDVVKAKGPGNDISVLTWSVGGSGAGADAGGGGGETTTTTSVPATTSTTTPTTTSTVPGGVGWSSRVTSEWQTGYCVEVTVTNAQKNTEKWTVQVPVKGTIYTFWSARYTRSGDTLTVSGESWNQSLKSGESTMFGWCSNF